MRYLAALLLLPALTLADGAVEPDSSALVVSVRVCGIPVLAIVDDGEVAAAGDPRDFAEDGEYRELLERALDRAPREQAIHIDVSGYIQRALGMTCPVSL